MVSALARWGIALIAPLLADTSAQARAGTGYARADFTVDYDTKTVTCPQGKTSSSWTLCTQRGHAAAVATFSPSDCGPCPARPQCTTSSRNRRQITILPRDLAQAQAAARAAEKTIPFWADYARRAGVEGAMHQATSHGARRARYRGLPKTRLDHVYMACALNLLRLEAGGPPLPWTVTTLGSLGTGGTPMVTKYQKFGDAYKAEAVKLYRESNQTIAETARNLGLKESTLANWVKKDKDNEAVAAGEAPLTPAERTRIRELEADVRRLNMENAFLKKASAYFASQNL